MKNTTVLLLVIAAFGIGFGINNAAVSDVAMQKVAVVNVQAVVNQSAQVKTLKAQSEAKAKDLQKWISVVQADINKQQTQEGKAKLAKKYEAELQKKQNDNRKEYSQKLQTIEKSISDTIVEQAKSKGYGLVLTNSVVLYGGDDITDIVAKAVK